jgi:hypothetical protein
VRELVFIALVLACPLMMIVMMRGHGHGGHAGEIGGRHDHSNASSEPKAAGLRPRRDEVPGGGTRLDSRKRHDPVLLLARLRAAVRRGGAGGMTVTGRPRARKLH